MWIVEPLSTSIGSTGTSRALAERFYATYFGRGTGGAAIVVVSTLIVVTRCFFFVRPMFTLEALKLYFRTFASMINVVSEVYH